MPQLTLQQALDLAVRYQRAGQTSEAEQLYQKILRHHPNHVNVLHLLGVLVAGTGRTDEAVELMRRAVRIAPSAVDCWLNLGVVLFGQSNYDDAADALAHAAELKPETSVLADLGTALRSAGRLQEAAKAYRQMMAIRAKEVAAGWTIASEAERTACDDLLILVHQDPANDAKVIFDDHATWNRLYAAPLATAFPRHDIDPTPSRRLRIGYISAYLSNLPIGRFFSGLLANHDHQQFEIFAYTDTYQYDQMTDQLRACCDHWRYTAALDDEQLAEQVRTDRIDILFDLGLHACVNRMLTFARKPAPVQITYLNYCSTTGLQTIDYRLSDSCFDPDDSQQPFYSEKTVRLRSYWCYPAPPEAPEVLARPNGAPITFGCLNDSRKFNPLTMWMWENILLNVPNSNLILHARDVMERQRVLAVSGIDPARIQFVPSVPMGEYFKWYNEIDIALDPTPWCGGTTTCDALWMGVPVVTLAGRTAVSRGGLSILSQVGLADLVAQSADRYIEIATALACDLSRLAMLRRTLRERMRQSPLMDAPAFTRDFESILRDVWKRWCATCKI